MKIVFVTHFFPPGHLGGTEVLTYGIVKSLIKKGHSVHVFCGEGWETSTDHHLRETDDLYDGIPVHRLHLNWKKTPNIFKYLYNNPDVERIFGQFLEKLKPDVVHVTSFYTLSASVVSAASSRKIPIVLTATDFWLLCAKNTFYKNDGTLCPGTNDPWVCAECLMGNSKVYRTLSALLPRKAVREIFKILGKIPIIANQRGFRGMLGDWKNRSEFLFESTKKISYIVTASQFLLDILTRYGVKPDKIIYSTYGLDLDWAKGFEEKTPGNLLRIGFIGQIIPFKEPGLLIQAVKDIPPDYPLQVKIYGDLKKSPEYGRYLYSLGKDDQRIKFLGTFENSRMGEVLRDIDVLVVPSSWYDFPLVIPSALATKTPVIATDLPGMNEMIQHQVNGLLFERKNWRMLHSLLMQVLIDPGLLSQLSSNINQMKSIHEYADEYVVIYKEISAKSYPN